MCLRVFPILYLYILKFLPKALWCGGNPKYLVHWRDLSTVSNTNIMRINNTQTLIKNYWMVANFHTPIPNRINFWYSCFSFTVARSQLLWLSLSTLTIPVITLALQKSLICKCRCHFKIILLSHFAIYNSISEV